MSDETYLYRRASDLTGAEWSVVFHLLQTRSGNRCEARTPDCLAPVDLSTLTRDRVSVHHRLPRGMGGSRDADTNALPRLLLLCGTGTTGCHGWTETNREAAFEAGFLVRRGVADPASVPVKVGMGERVFLDSVSPSYLRHAPV